MHYYTLPVPPPTHAGDPKTGLILGVEHFRAAEVLRDDRIVYYESPTRMNFYQYHRWSSDPATMLTDIVAERLKQTGVFADVRRLPSREPVDCVLRGRVSNFEEVDDQQGVKGRVTLGLTLVRSRDHKLLWSDMRRAESVAQCKGVPGVVEAINAASARVLDETLSLMLAEVEREFAQASRPDNRKGPER